MFKKFTNGCVALVQKYLPDAFIFAAFLTVLTFVLGVTLTGQTPLDMVKHWGAGAWGLLAFSMQMVLVLVTGHTLASTKFFSTLLKRIASCAKTPIQAIVIVSLVSGIACWLNWGFGLVIGALLAKELAKQVEEVDYRLLIASAYTGFIVWHGGLSASIPLQLATAGDEAAKAALLKMTGGAVTQAVPVAETIFSPLNLIISFGIILMLPIINSLMHPDKEHTVKVKRELLFDGSEKEEEMKPKSEMTPAERVENSRVISLILFVLMFAAIIYHFATKGFDLNLNIVNLIFLTFGILLHGTPKRFLAAFKEAVKGADGIVLQFPFYAGIMGMMTGKTADGASLAALISNWFVSISTVKTFPVFTFLSAGIVNFFVPSGGGQWSVQGPIMMPAAAQLGVPFAKAALGIAWGDAWTNMIQPFWALPALGIAGLGARDIMGYCLITLIASGIFICAAFLIL